MKNYYPIDYPEKRKKRFLFYLFFSVITSVLITMNAAAAMQVPNKEVTLTFVDAESEITVLVQPNDVLVYPSPQNVNDANSFKGWYLDPRFETRLKNDIVPLTSKTFYAKYEPITYSVQVVGPEGSLWSSEKVLSGTVLEEIAVPIFTNKRFVGFDPALPIKVTADLVVEILYEELPNQEFVQSIIETEDGYEEILFLSSNYKVPIIGKDGHVLKEIIINDEKVPYEGEEIEIIVKENLHISYIYEPIEYTIYLVSYEELPFTEITYTYGEELASLPELSKSSAIFLGWFYDRIGSEEFLEETMPASNIYLYPGWEVIVPEEPLPKQNNTPTTNLYQVRLLETNDTVLSTTSYNNGTTLLLSDLAEPTKTGYTFEGYYSDANLNSALTSVTISSDMNLYVKWTTNINSLNYVLNGGTGLSNTTVAYSAEVVSPTAPTKTNATFLNWYTDEALTTVATFPFNMPDQAVTLYADWLDAYSVKYVDYDETVLQSTLVDEGSTISISAPSNPSRIGYNFTGWDSSLPSTMPSNDVVIKALYSVVSYDVSFNSNGGTAINTQSIAYGTSVSAPSEPTLSGSTFIGWYQNVDLTTEQTFPFSMPANNVTLYAKWQSGYSLEFLDYDGTVLQSDVFTSGTDLTNYTLPTNPTRTGYTFAIWDTVVPNPMPANDVTITATYSVNSYDLLYALDGGSGLTDTTVDFGSTITEPTEPTKAGTLFVDWYTNSSLTSIATFPFPMPDHAVTLYAKWASTYTLSFVDYNSTVISSMDYMETDDLSLVSTPTSPTRTGYLFTGWDQAIPSVMPANDVTIQSEYTVELDTLVNLINNYDFSNLAICTTTEVYKIYDEILVITDNDPYITVTNIVDNGSGSFTISLEQTHPDIAGTTSTSIQASFTACDGYTNTLLGQVSTEISNLIPTGLFKDIHVPNLNASSKDTGIQGRIQRLIDKYGISVSFVYDDTVLNTDANTSTAGMTGTAEGIIITIEKTYNGVTSSANINVAASFIQSKEPDTYTFPDSFVDF